MTTPTQNRNNQPAPALQAPARLTRVVLFVGANTEIDYVLAAEVPLIAIVEDLIPRINHRLRRLRRPQLDTGKTYQLCWADSRPLDPQKSLDESGVVDGDALWLLVAEATEKYEPVIETVSTAIAREAQRQFSTVDEDTPRRIACGLGAALIAWAELIVLRQWWFDGGWVPAAVSWAFTAALVVAAWLAARAAQPQRRAAAEAFAWTAIIPLCTAAAVSIPGPPGAWHVLAALVAANGWMVMLAVLTGGRHIGATSTAITMSGFAAGALIVQASGWQVPPQRVATVALLAVLVLVTFATSFGVAGSGIPGPWFPSLTGSGVFETRPGAPRDTVSPVYPAGTETPEQIAAWTRRGNAIITGVLVGCGVVTVVAARYAVIRGQPSDDWKQRPIWYLLFTLTICAILLLRSRTFVDRWQSVTLVLSAVLAVAVVIGRYAAASTPPAMSTTLICVGATVAIAVAGLINALVIVNARISAPIRRWVELSEYVLLFLVVPMAVLLLNLIPWARNLVGGP
jgi:type VII secretion integral membrane protein EccD